MAPVPYGESDNMSYVRSVTWREKVGAELNKARNSDASGCGLDRRGVEGRARDLSWGWAPAVYSSRNMS